MAGIPKAASVGIIVLALCCIVLIFACLKQREMMRKNKHKYDLRNVSFVIEPVGDDKWRLVFYYGDLVLHSELVNEVDILTDKKFFYKAFIKWCEEESK